MVGGGDECGFGVLGEIWWGVCFARHGGCGFAGLIELSWYCVEWFLGTGQTKQGGDCIPIVIPLFDCC